MKNVELNFPAAQQQNGLKINSKKRTKNVFICYSTLKCFYGNSVLSTGP